MAAWLILYFFFNILSKDEAEQLRAQKSAEKLTNYITADQQKKSNVKNSDLVHSDVKTTFKTANFGTEMNQTTGPNSYQDTYS